MLGFAEHWNRDITDKYHSFQFILFVEFNNNFLYIFRFIPFIVYDERRQPLPFS